MIVRKGKHYCRLIDRLWIFSKNNMTYKFRIDDSWYWADPLKPGWSKVLGTNWGGNHKNSVRLVYQCKSGQGQLGYYFYVNGVSPQEDTSLKKTILSNVQKGDYEVRFYKKKNKMCMDFLGKTYTRKAKKLRCPMRSNPYIGGDYVIDHDWKVLIKKL